MAALRNQPGLQLELLSQSAPRRLAEGAGNVSIHPARTNAELRAAYEDATIAVVPLLENLHASGITAIQEAVLAGLPVIATDVGGLRHYFGDDAITYIPGRSPDALRAAVREVSTRADRAAAMTRRAQARIAEAGLDAEGYIRRHVELSAEMLQ